jgi:hypothetical protein
MAHGLLTRMLLGAICGMGGALWTVEGQAQVAEEILPGRPHRLYIPGAEPVVVYSPGPTPAPSLRPYGAPAPSVRQYGAPAPSVRQYGAPAPSVRPYGAPAPSVRPYPAAPSVTPYGEPEPMYGPRYYSAEPGEESGPIYVGPRPIVERTRNYFRRQPVRRALRALAP